VTDRPVLFLVPARGGSRRIPGKNGRLVAGIPLVGWGVRIARLAAAAVPGGPHRIVCSTDDPNLATIARTWGAEVLDRPASLATDEATSVDVAIHALDALDGVSGRFRAVVLVQPTSPLTDPADVRAAVEQFDGRGGGGAVVAVTKTHPVDFHVDDQGRRTEAAEADRVLTGAFYVIAPDLLRRERSFVPADRTMPYEVPAERKVDIDEPADLALAEALARSRAVPLFPLGGHAIGLDPVFVIAEAGVNHNGDAELAHRLVEAAADSGADAVKFQTFDPAALASASAPTAAYQRSAGAGQDQQAMLARLALPADAWPALQAHAAELGLVFLSTPFDDASADLLDRLEVPAFKVGSGELTNTPFLERLARRGRPMIVSTGMADMAEVAAAVDAIRGTGNSHLALLHCVSAYPAEPGDANLRAMQTLRAAFGVWTGWSDHTPGIELPIAATALGAAIIEKHLTLDRTMRGPDHHASLEPAEFRAMIDAIRTVEVALGSGDKRPTAAERDVASVARRSLHWARDLAAGQSIGGDDLVAVRPGTGLAPGRAPDVVGRRTARAVTGGTIVAVDDIETDR
jgi:N-acetylneuraminate synthase/N,N'-diacetyllegionaminate synthase